MMKKTDEDQGKRRWQGDLKSNGKNIEQKRLVAA